MTDNMDFNGANTQDAAFDPIPNNTIARVRLTIRPGGAGPEGWLTQSKTSAALYLNTEAIVLEGQYARRRVFTRIGFKGKSVNEHGDDTYANRGRALIRGILESARGIKNADQSQTARTARTIGSLGDLNGLEFAARIDVEKDRDDPQDQGRNVIKAAIGPDHAQYIAVMGTMPSATASSNATQGTGASGAGGNAYAAATMPASISAPSWAR